MEDEEVIDLAEFGKKLFSVFLKTWKVLFIFAVLGAGLMGLRTRWNYRPLYRSQVTFAVSREMNGEKNFFYNQKAAENMALSVKNLLQSDLMTEAVCDTLETETVPAKLSFSQIGTTNLFTIYADAQNGEDAKRVMDAFVENYPKVFRISLADIELDIIEYPEIPEKPFRQPNYVKQCVKGVVAAVIFYLCLVCCYIFFRKTITEEEEIEMYLHSQCIGTVPYIKVSEKGRNPLITKDNLRYSGLKEALRGIRIFLQQKEKESGKKVFLFTSAVPNEGKTTIVSNLARVLAEKEKRVALVDLDFRNPSVMKLIELKKEARLGKVKFDKNELLIFADSEYPNMHIYCKKQKSERSAEVFTSEQMKKLLHQLRENYDYVLIDTPPLLAVGDALVAASEADASIFVIKEDYASVSNVKEAMELLHETTPNIAGCIINGSKTSVSLYGRYGYGYGYHYHYGYGYGEKS